MVKGNASIPGSLPQLLPRGQAAIDKSPQASSSPAASPRPTAGQLSVLSGAPSIGSPRAPVAALPPATGALGVQLLSPMPCRDPSLSSPLSTCQEPSSGRKPPVRLGKPEGVVAPSAGGAAGLHVSPSVSSAFGLPSQSVSFEDSPSLIAGTPVSLFSMSPRGFGALPQVNPSAVRVAPSTDVAAAAAGDGDSPACARKKKKSKRNAEMAEPAAQ
jgi:hypothetical protein